ncbi:MAG: hypothetical protein HLUCCO02_09905 [Idiomarinaceae bacterium HL-53]|nr:MAG: hypothetical protein HLUCCO02_09905 [Idiomarinaceae bacterium HL-53]CUS49448.1 hypothetical protein Ga0003345_2447 [Idiomarinaceae bacterium HL-53]
MPRVLAKSDTLNELNKNFTQTPLTRGVFLNSVPKCGTHLVRNIFRMFVPVEQQYHDTFIQIPVLNKHLKAFDPSVPRLSWGHLLFSDASVIALHETQHILVVRDPYDWVLARARFFLSDNFQGSMEPLKGGRVSVEEVLNMMIFGIYQKAPSLLEIFTHNAACWMGTNVKIVKMEEVLFHLKNIDNPAAEEYFADLLRVPGRQRLPEDWKDRVTIGSDKKQSGTFRDNLSGLSIEIPKELPPKQKELVDYAAPGLRKLLGYE